MQRSQIKYDIPDEWLKNRDKGLCPVCAKTKDEFEPRRQVYCSQKCADKYQSKIITWPELREVIFKRDGKICKDCKFDESKVEEMEKKLYNKALKDWETPKKIKEMKVSVLKDIAKKEELLNDNKKLIKEVGNFHDKPSEWNYRIGKDFHVDHIVAIVNGGDQWDEKNLQVLCEKCHHKKTAKDMGKRVKGNKTLSPNKIQDLINKK